MEATKERTNLGPIDLGLDDVKWFHWGTPPVALCGAPTMRKIPLEETKNLKECPDCARLKKERGYQ